MPVEKILNIVSFSGGKDSSAMLLRMLEIGMPVDRILFAETFMEFPEMYDYHIKFQDYLNKHHPGQVIETVKTKSTWDEWFLGKITRGKLKGKQRGWPLTAFPCWWSRESKYKTLEPHCDNNYRYIGIAFDEPSRIGSGKGYRYPLNEWGWTEQDALDYLESKNMAVQLHRNFSRSGCFCCPKSSFKSLKTLYKLYPDLWKKLLSMDEKAENCFKPDMSVKKIQDMIEDEILFENQQGMLFEL